MLNMFDYWAGLWRSGSALTETGFKLAETLGAAHSVVESRTRTIADAARSPLKGDYAELGRMVPEKVEAFSKGAMAAMSNMHVIQSQMMQSWQLMARLGMAGRLPTATEWGTLATGQEKIVDHLSRAGGQALAPVHRTATANARRLSRKKQAG
ncbi:MAG TPA: hypothetical protein VF463_08290 [Sphingobium sp.]